MSHRSLLTGGIAGLLGAWLLLPSASWAQASRGAAAPTTATNPATPTNLLFPFAAGSPNPFSVTTGQLSPTATFNPSGLPFPNGLYNPLGTLTNR